MRPYAVYVLPVAVAAMLFEWLLFRRRTGKAYPWRETGITVAIAAGHQLSKLPARALFAGLYWFCWKHRLLTVPLDTAWGVVTLFLAVEFAYYWEHRLSHTVRWLWATHAVHHSPNELTLSSAFRLGWTGPISGAGLFVLPLVLLGFHPLAIVGALAVNLLYQFWLHTQLVPRLGWFDRIFNSPSNHRVHHASNPEYLDRNFGGVLMVFDRLFGTYAQERAESPCRYGLVHPEHSVNPLAVALGEWHRLLRDATRAGNPRELAHALFGPPQQNAQAAPRLQTIEGKPA
ncbi:MAG: sterol desaturase family protein [Nevskia sp.]|nr:sterol desaturase family protein [Nevskia sp.]